MFFAAAALYIGRLVNPAQLRTVVRTAITTALAERGPTVISLPGDAAADAPTGSLHVALPATVPGAASAADLGAMAARVNQADTVPAGLRDIEQQEAGFIPFGTDFVNPDFSRVAEALGAKGIRIEEPGDVRDGLQAALGHKDGPVVVDVVVDKYALSRPAHVPAETVKGFTLSLTRQVLSGKMDEVIATAEHNIRLL